MAVAAGFSPVSIGTETMGSLIMPSDRAALYTIKPTVKIVPQDGIIPITLEADSAGPMTKSVLDLADILDVIVDPSKTTVPAGGYRSAVTGEWGNIRIGVLEPEKWLFPTKIVKFEKEASDQMVRLSVTDTPTSLAPWLTPLISFESGNRLTRSSRLSLR